LLLDTTILIDHLRGRAEAIALLRSLASSATPQSSDVAAAELLTGARDGRDQATISRFLSSFVLHPIIEEDSRRSLQLLTQFRLAHGIGWQDCLIAAQALRLNLAVATTNARHFAAVTNLRVIRPY
jgi:predicted nucleic acid-binding protein